MRRSKQVNCGGVKIGGGAPITIQSMTNTDTRDVRRTVEQIDRLKEAGCDIVRCAIPDMEAAFALKEIKKRIQMPLVADIHFDYRLALSAIENGADKVRINPGNIGNDDRVQTVVKAAKERGIPIRVGVNAGSLEKDILKKYGGVSARGLAESGLNNVKRLERMGFEDIVISIKASDIKLNYDAHRILSDKTEYPLHIGITESGTETSGGVKSAIGIGSLLLAGIGDTLRVSFTGDPVKEVSFAKEILKALNLRKGFIQLVSCPTCGRCQVELDPIVKRIEAALPAIERKRQELELPTITVAVMGCEVNGPGEAKEADIGIACGRGKGMIFKKGEACRMVEESHIAEELIRTLTTELS